MSLEKIKDLVNKHMGMDISTLGEGALLRALRKREAGQTKSELEVYYRRLLHSRRELHELCERLVVPETWFFREKEAFVLLRQIVSQWKYSGIMETPLRVLSIPCSTGEEPYSIAITLLQAGLNPEEFHIDAVDISKTAVEKAEKGLYGSTSFHRNDLEHYKNYFEPVGKQCKVRETVRESVHFHHENVMHPFMFAIGIQYPVIFLRNLLIYLDYSSRKKVLEKMDRLLTPEGYLFVGAAETLIPMASEYTRVLHPHSFAFKKEKEEKKTAIKPIKKPEPDSVIKEAKSLLINKVSPPLQEEEKSDYAESLKKAQTYANQGRLGDALKLCEGLLEQNYKDVSVYGLKGQIHQARLEDRLAESCFQKALYFDPYHYESLVHLSLLMDQWGRNDQAKIYRQRLNRLAESQKQITEKK